MEMNGNKDYLPVDLFSMPIQMFLSILLNPVYACFHPKEKVRLPG